MSYQYNKFRDESRLDVIVSKGYKGAHIKIIKNKQYYIINEIVILVRANSHLACSKN